MNNEDRKTSSSLLANLFHKPYFWIFLFVVGLFTWGASPIRAWHAIGLVLFVLVVIVLSRQVNRKAFPLALLALLLTTIDIFDVATLHDLNVKSYASALCCDGSYSYSEQDRKSTRLNSSHLGISYALFF